MLKPKRPSALRMPPWANVDAVSGGVVVAAQITQGQLALRLDIPAFVVDSFFTSVFAAQGDADVVHIAADLLSFFVEHFKVAVHMMEAQDYIQVVALVAHFGNVEVDSAAVVVAAATRIAGITIGIADGYAAVAGVVGFGFHYFVVAQLVVGIFIFEAKIAVAAYLGPFHPYPDAFFVFAFMAPGRPTASSTGRGRARCSRPARLPETAPSTPGVGFSSGSTLVMAFRYQSVV